VPTKRAAVADVHAPSVALPLRFILTGIVASLGWLVLTILAGLAIYGWEMAAILRARKRRNLD
jgi:hypothetical protein